MNRVTIAGMGPGGPGLLTAEALDALAQAGLIVGSERLLEQLPAAAAARRVCAVDPQQVLQALEDMGGGSAVVLMSGDTGFYSGARRLLPLLAGFEVRLLPGISSVQLLAARLGRPWQDWHLASAHGQPCDPVCDALNHPAVCYLTGGQNTPQAICRALAGAGLGGAAVTVGQRLSYPDERIAAGTAARLAGQTFDPLAVVLVENPAGFARRAVTTGIADGEFVRGEVPMTKQEVRAAALARLELCPGDAAWDVGAGTGSVSVEMALCARRGRVYAVEREPDACGLILLNRAKFGVCNLELVRGEAPGALEPLPAPDAVFLGGTGGALGDILTAALAKNPAVRAAVTAVTPETLHQALESMERLGFGDVQLAQISVARGVKRGAYHLLTAQNPVFLISGRGPGAKV